MSLHEVSKKLNRVKREKEDIIPLSSQLKKEITSMTPRKVAQLLKLSPGFPSKFSRGVAIKGSDLKKINKIRKTFLWREYTRLYSLVDKGYLNTVKDRINLCLKSGKVPDYSSLSETLGYKSSYISKYMLTGDISYLDCRTFALVLWEYANKVLGIKLPVN